MIASDLLQLYRKMAESGDLLQPHTAIELLNEIERYRKALEEIEYKASSYGLAAPLVKVCKRIAREALKGDETA